MDEDEVEITDSCDADDSVGTECVIHSEFEGSRRRLSFAYLAFPMFVLQKVKQG